MPAAAAPIITPETAIHRIGGGAVENLTLKAKEEALMPPGISVLIGGSPTEAAEQMRQAFPDENKFARIHTLSETVGTTTVAQLQATGFALYPNPSSKFPNHARVTHPDGVRGFTEHNLKRLSQAFDNMPTPRI